MGRSFFFSHFFTPGSVSQLSCSVSGPGRWLNIDGPEAPSKSGGDCRSEGFFPCKSGEIYVWHMWHMTLWDSDIAVLQTPVLDIYHGVLLPWFHTRDQEKCNDGSQWLSTNHPLAFWWLWWLCEIFKYPQIGRGPRSVSLGPLVPWLVTLQCYISYITSTFFHPKHGHLWFSHGLVPSCCLGPYPLVN